MRRVSLQTKVLTLIISLILFVIFLLSAIYVFFEYEQTEQNMGNQALHVASTISFNSTIIEALEQSDQSGVIQRIAERVREKVGAEFVVIGDSNSVRYSHPEPHKIGKTMVGGDNNKALIDGEYYISKAVGSLGPSLRGKAPVFSSNGEIIGIVSVGFLMEDVKSVLFNRLIEIAFYSFIVLLLGTIGGLLLTRDIRKDTLGLEPHEIASLFRERNAILYSIKEGIIAVDYAGRITMMNQSAQNILNLQEDCTNKKIEDVFTNTKMYDVLRSGKIDRDEEIILRDKTVIVNRTPITENGQVVGGVSTFRDKTEIKEMLNTLSEVRRYSEDLRSQTHEYTNKLYVLSGLLQLGHYQEAIELIQKESNVHKHQGIRLNNIKDRTIQAVLLGKIGKASEKKIQFDIDPLSSIQELPEHLDMNKMITILGNLLDNALEAVIHQDNKEVIFFTTDVGNDIVFEIADTGPGIKEPHMSRIFERGFSTKGEKNRGYGLATVHELVNNLQGTIEIQNRKDGGTIFSVFLPKVIVKQQVQ